jgi:hypothetical protein
MSGFSAVLGNPPWEVLRMEEQSWFTGKSEPIVNAKNAAQRKKLISALELSDNEEDQQLFNQWYKAKEDSESQKMFLSKSNQYPLSGVGSINLFALFTELSRDSLNYNGHMGIIIPPNIFTGATYLNFLNDLLETKTLKEGIVFENESLVFPSVHHAFKFALVSISGPNILNPKPTFTGYIRLPEEINDSDRRYYLQKSDIEKINPNTGNIPMFRNSIDAEITKKIHSQCPPLWLESNGFKKNHWDVDFTSMFHMSGDSEKFHWKEDLESNGWQKEGYNWHDRYNNRKKTPLHEGKMIWLYDHRYGTYEGQTDANLRQGVVPKVTELQHSNPDYIPLHRYWIDSELVEDSLNSRNWTHNWMFMFRDVGPSERTMIISVIPRLAASNDPLLLFRTANKRNPAVLLANFSSLICDYALRQKNTRMKLFVVKQAPIFSPPSDETPTPWPGDKLLDFITPRVLELTYTSHDLKDWAKDLGYDGEPFIWDKERRFKLKSELDALFFHMYGLNREQVEWVLESFNVLKGYEEKSFDKGGYAEFKTKRLVLESYDAMDYDIKKGRKYEPRWLTQDEEIHRLLSGENLHIEYKETMKQPREGGNEATVSKSFRKAVIGMANNEGGTILIGVKDKKSGGGEPVGFDDGLINNPDMAQMTAIQLIESKSAYAATLINPKVVEINGINILRIDIKPAKKPIYCNLGDGDNQFYLRLANKMSDPERLVGTELENYLYQRFDVQI